MRRKSSRGLVSLDRRSMLKNAVGVAVGSAVLGRAQIALAQDPPGKEPVATAHVGGVLTPSRARAVGTDIEKHIKDGVLGKIANSAKLAMKDWPNKLPDGLSNAGRRYLEQVHELLQDATQATSWNAPQLASFATEVAWVRLVSDLGVAYMKRGGGAGLDEPTCVTKCANEYTKCIGENGCDDSGWVCLCCTPCSLQYSGCVASCTLGGGLGLFAENLA